MDDQTQTVFFTCKVDTEKQFLSEFIDCYKNCRSLWDVSHPEYTSRNVRAHSYDQLHKIMKKYKHDATDVDVKKKINTLRSNFNREKNKLRLSMENGDVPVYKPHLWWFEKISFLLDLEQPRSNDSENETVKINTVIFEKHENTVPKQDHSQISFDEVMLYANAYEENAGDGDVNVDASGDLEGIGEEEEEHEEFNSSKIQCKRFADETLIKPMVKIPKITRTKKLLHTFPKRHKYLQISNRSLPMRPSTSITDGDTIDHLCKAWAGNLREMSKQQRIIAERSISEIVFQGQLGVLTFDSIPKLPPSSNVDTVDDLESQSRDHSKSTAQHCSVKSEDDAIFFKGGR